jgi:hypothetical protein
MSGNFMPREALKLDLLPLACSSISLKSRSLFTKNSSWQAKQSIPEDQIASPVPEIMCMYALHKNAAEVTVQALFHYVNA